MLYREGVKYVGLGIKLKTYEELTEELEEEMEKCGQVRDEAEGEWS